MPEEKDPTFKVVIRGTRFTLTKSQIEFDGPNYFTSCFLGEFNEAKTRVVELFRSPELFPIIMEHLCGYEVLPLGPQYVGVGVSQERVVRNLRADAEFYQLDGLIEVCDEFLSQNPSKQYILIGGSFDFKPTTPISDQTNILSEKENFKMFVSDAKATQEIIPALSGSPEQCKSFFEFAFLGAAEKYVRRKLPNHEPPRSNIIGWRAAYRGQTYLELLILVEQSNKK